ncbi:MAG: hypothetical protein NTV01_17175 [Bacteroidia bacterium]|nr:hypothetical protein [Bacteroidia bacterium]
MLKLPEEVQLAVRHGELSTGHARAILGLEDAARQIAACRKIIKRGLSVRQVEELVRTRTTGTRRQGEKTATLNVRSSLTGIEDRLRHLLGTKVQVRQHGAGKGEIVIEYYSADDLDRILEVFEELHHRSR